MFRQVKLHPCKAFDANTQGFMNGGRFLRKQARNIGRSNPRQAAHGQLSDILAKIE
jgi:hypothetical protein